MTNKNPHRSGSKHRRARHGLKKALRSIFIVTLVMVAWQIPGSRPGLQAQNPPGPCDPPILNPIVCENSKLGNPPSEWDISGAGDLNIQGFATDISVNQGETVRFKIDTDASDYRFDIYRMGYYGGDGARQVATEQPSASLPQVQPACLTDPSTGLVDCGNWAESATWAVPLDATSGIYFAKLVREDGTPGASHIVFIVRDDDGLSDILFQTADTTWQAYNRYGGNSLYVGSPDGRAYKVSYNRPFTTRDCCAEDWVFNAEYPMVRWLEANGYNVSYFTDVDSDRRGAEILEHEIFLSVGHDEYWSAGQRANVEAARNAGVNLAFFSGNEVFWKTRWEDSIDASGTPFRTLVCYKETHANAKIDPLPNVWTGTWRDPRFSPPADGGRPENELTGTIFTVNSGATTAIQVPEPEGKLRFWRNTSVATLAPGEVAVLSDNTLGYEWDEALDNGFQPAGLVRLSSTTVNVPSLLLDFGSTYGPGTATHNLTLYRASSGAIVFGAGTVQWTWGLDGNHDQGSSTPDIRMQQATVNLFADMSVQPDTLQAGLVPAIASTDTTAPMSVITAPADGASVQIGVPVAIIGTATDADGIVSGVEVSVDGGAAWAPATGSANWSYNWTPDALGSVNIKSRAVDDSGNLESPSLGITVTVTSDPPSQTCPCRLWDNATLPSVEADPDTQPIEVGTKFSSDEGGFITGLRFYKGATNAAPHVGNLWTSAGTLLASVTFTNETASGWQEVSLPTPVAITASTTYVASYHTTVGQYAVDQSYFVAEYANPPLRGPADGPAGGNGVFKTGASGFPTQTFSASNYWVDVVFDTVAPPDANPPTVSSVAPVDGATNVGTGTLVTATFNEAMDGATITTSTFELRDPANAFVPATVSYDGATLAATLVPSSALTASTTYTATAKGGAGGVTDVAGNALAVDFSWTFTTIGPPPDQGPGGPILVVATASDPFSRYYAEILRTEGFNAFEVSDISSVSAVTLTAYDVVILGTMSLTPAQITMFSDWVNAGGNLIAMRPDKQLAGLLGITDISSTLSEAYLLVDTSAGPGAGIVDQTIQFHGIADLYTLSGASSTATLYSDATTPIPNPAVTLHSVGTNGGQAAAFTYDLARSIVHMRQGNPAWTGQERDNILPVRSNDQFFGAASGNPQPDWVDLNKVEIPQADEQQRLLANLILEMNLDKKPLPRFWYFPRGLKAAVVMTGDDHSAGGTAGRFDQYIANSPPGCSVEDWECIRSTSYIYPNSPLTDAQAATYAAAGFEVALHISSGCDDWTPALLDSFYSDQLSTWTANYPSLPSPSTHRLHCLVWSDYASQPQVELSYGIRLDTNYYYYPPSWIADRPGFFTGSGMPMRFAALNGTMIDVYQATTQMTDESGQTYPLTIDGLLDKAIGSEGYYGAFVANMHTDIVASSGSDAIVSAALARGIPIVSAKQMLTWLDGRNGSSFGSLAWSADTLSFTITVGANANGLETMVPTTAAIGALISITRDGTPVPFGTEIIKGVEYAFFPATAGAYQATYSSAPDTTPPTVSNVLPTDGTTEVTTGTTVTATFSEAMDAATITTSTFELRDAANTLIPATVSYNGGTRIVTLAPSGALTYSTTYTATVKGGAGGLADTAGNPLAADFIWSFTTEAPPPPPTCPCSLWDDTATPAVPADPSTQAVEVGVKFRSDGDGFITALRFYKGTTNTGLHVGNLWASDGTLLASVTFTNETASGWQEENLPTPVAITANTTYVASYHAPAGHHANTELYFVTSEFANPPLRALLNGGDGANGVFKFGASGFPTQTFNATNYWVDVVFDTVVPPDTTPPTVSNATPADGTTGVNPGTLVIATFSEAMDAATITTSTFELRDAANALVPATVIYNGATRLTTLTPNAPLASVSTYTATVRGGSGGVTDVAGNAMVTDFFWSFTTGTPPPPPTCPCRLWDDTTTPEVEVDPDTQPIEVGVKFRSDVNGFITGLRFHKGATNTGTHLGNLWANDGTLLANVTFTNETASGWQEVNLSTPVAVTANTTYIASYHTTVGQYAVDELYFGTEYTNAPLRALADGAQGGNGLFKTGSSGFPTNSFNAGNYWVDVVFDTVAPPDTTPPTVSSTAPTDGATGVDTGTVVTATFSEAMDAATITTGSFEVRDAINTLVPAAVTYDGATQTATLTPSSVLASGTTYTARVKGGAGGVTDVAGNVLATDFSWSFTTTTGPQACPCRLWDNTTLPTVTESGDTGAVELGVKFRADVDGFITGLRFYKGAGNTGPHIGNLWASDGTLLASVTFTNETASGWQEVSLPTSVAVTANTTYIASYHTTAGRYALDGGYFGTEYTNALLRALANGAEGGNGVYVYGAGGFPTNSFNAGNYWVDVVFDQNP